MNQFLQKHQRNLIAFAKENNITYLGLFGSHARGDARKDSDVDMLVEFSKPIGLLQHASVQLKLESLLQRKVDLISRKFLRPTFKKYIQDDVVQIL